MNTIASDNLLQSQLAAIQTREQIGYRVAAKGLDAARQQGAAVLELLDAAANLAGGGEPTLGQLVSGLGQNLDVRS